MDEECYNTSSWLEIHKCIKVCLPLLPEECTDFHGSRLREDRFDFFRNCAIAVVVVSILRILAVELMDKIYFYTFDLKEKQRRKASSKTVKCFTFLYFLYIGLRIAVKSKVWSDEGRRIMPSSMEELEFTDLQYYYYMCYIGWYGHRSLTHVMEYTQSDWLAMSLHHAITTGLVIISYIYDYGHFGTAVMVLNDAADISLAGAKMLKYLGYETAGTCFMVSLVFTWGYPRLYLYWKYIVFTAVVLTTNEATLSYEGTTCIMLLLALYCLYLMWYWMILRVFYRRLSKGVLEDHRSEAEGDKKNQ